MPHLFCSTYGGQCARNNSSTSCIVFVGRSAMEYVYRPTVWGRCGLARALRSVSWAANHGLNPSYGPWPEKKISSTITCISVRQLSEIILRRVEGIYDEGGKSGFASRCYFFLNCFFLIILSNTVGNPLADWLRGNLSHYSSDTKECNRCFLAVSHLLQELRVYVCSEIRLTRTVTPIVYS